jgi:hypothetical protein
MMIVYVITMQEKTTIAQMARYVKSCILVRFEADVNVTDSGDSACSGENRVEERVAFWLGIRGEGGRAQLFVRVS